MMRLFASGLFICHIILQSQARKFGIKNGESLLASQSRYRSSRDYIEDYPSVNGKESNLPVTFQAPRHSVHDYWRYKHDHENRRTFFEDSPYGQTTTYPDFFQFMTSLFGGRDDAAPEHPPPYNYNRNRVAQPHPIPPYSYRPTEPNYIPQPKPIRASVIKLETLTRSPYPSFEHEMSTKFYPHAGNILKHVLIENAKTHTDFQPILPFKPLPVLPKPVQVPATTVQPTYKKLYNHSQHAYNTTDFKYPESVQDQLPHLNVGEVKIPYESERPLPKIFDTLPTKVPTFANIYPQTTTNALGLIDIRSLVLPDANRREKPVVIQFGRDAPKEEPRVQNSFPGAVEKVKRPVIKFTKKVSSRDKAPVERVTNLTVEGLSKVERDNANIHKYVNHFNMRNLINYELSKFNVSKNEHENSTKIVDIDDELSLDAKILKDTNWDGLTIPTTTTPTTELPRETTTVVVEIKPKKVTYAFWEIGENKTTAKPETTTEGSTIEIFTTEETSTVMNDHRFDYQERKSITEETPETTTMERTTPSIIRRRYSRRPKILTFTPYPTPEELHMKLINRNHFPKRSKPNITLAFGKKDIVRREGLEVMKFSDDDVKKRRRIGKRRQVYKRIRVLTSERPPKND